MLRATTEVCAQECAAGTAPDGSGGCANCAVGSFSSALDDSSCNACPTGSYAPEGATICTTCETGLYDHDQNATTACEYCPIGRFTLEDGAQACQSCWDGSRWLRVHGDREQPAACEICPPGLFVPGSDTDYDYCDSCPTGSFSPAVRSEIECAVQDLILDWEVSASCFRTSQTASLAFLIP